MAPSASRKPADGRERLFRAVAEQRWEEALDLVHLGVDSGDPVARQAGTLLSDAMAGAAEAVPDALLEKLLLLAHAGHLALSDEGADRVVEALVARHRDHPERAVRYARFRPDLPTAAAVLARFGPAVRTTTSGESGTRQATDPSGTVPDARRSIFRSAQERAFHAAARRVFPGALLVPNAALHAVIDYDAVAGLLSPAERNAVFRALIDLVVCDAEGVPLHFLELDSPLHDDLDRDARDRVKERALAAAGCPLVRIRASGPADIGTFVRLLSEAFPS